MSLQLSRIGLGAFRMNQMHLDVVELALRSGLNVLDTSSNYGFGQSEVLIGNAVRNVGGREKICVMTKFGYVQGEDLELLKQKRLPPYHAEDFIQVTPDCKHCLHPDFMRHQLHRSLKRLQMSQIDIYFVHNPEYLLMIRRGKSKEEAQNYVTETLERTFEGLEEEVLRGTIRGYGVSSNGFGLPEDHQMFVPYQALVRAAIHAARKAKKKHPNLALRHSDKSRLHSLMALQLPINLLEKDGLVGCASWARDQGLAVFVNRPLNAVDHRTGSLVRLATYEPEPGYRKCFEETSTFLLDTKSSVLDHDSSESLEALRKLIKDLDKNIDEFTSIEHFLSDFSTQVLPVLELHFGRLKSFLYGETTGKEKQSDKDLYLELARKIFLFFESYEKNLRHLSSTRVTARVQQLGLRLPTETRLQDEAIDFLLFRKEVSCVLMGLTKPRYLEDAISAFRRFGRPHFTLDFFNDHIS